MEESTSPTGHTLRPRNTSVVFGYWNALTWTRRWHGLAKASPPFGGRSRCERFSLTPPPNRTERHGNGAASILHQYPITHLIEMAGGSAAWDATGQPVVSQR